MPREKEPHYCYCGKQLEEFKISCSNPICNKQYYKTKKTMWVDPWPYFPIGFIGFWVVLYPLSFITVEPYSISGIMIIMISAIIPIMIVFYLHYIRQKRKGLKFPWDDKDEKFFAQPNWGKLIDGVEG